MYYPRVAGDAAQVQAIDLEPDLLATDGRIVALRLGLRRVFALTEEAQIPLASRRVAPDLGLTVSALAVWASHFFHSKSLPPTQPYSHCLSVWPLDISPPGWYDSSTEENPATPLPGCTEVCRRRHLLSFPLLALGMRRLLMQSLLRVRLTQCEFNPTRTPTIVTPDSSTL